MKDTALYDELLGLNQPWYVAGVRLEVVRQEVEVEVRSKDTTWACPECQGRFTKLFERFAIAVLQECSTSDLKTIYSSTAAG
ncbi:MAG: hypothetical protein HS132_09310 [Planctomycetia bacterium]|nr:hypothetical protein [Planctomycetia bacterium]